MSQQLSLQNIINYFAAIATDHGQIKSFYYGPKWDVSVSDEAVYPIMIVIPQPSTLRKDSIVLRHKIQILDQISKDVSNRNSVLSDSFQTCLDIKAFIWKDFFYDIFPSDESGFEPYYENYDDELGGWSMDIELQLDWLAEVCSIPGLYPSGVTFQATSGFYSINLANYLPLTGGILSGGLTGTSAIFDSISATTYFNLPNTGLSADTYWISGSTGHQSIHALNDSGLDATGNYSVAEGEGTLASGEASHAEGANTTAMGLASHSEGSYTFAIGQSSHSEGDSTFANGHTAHAEGFTTTAGGDYSHAEGEGTTASGEASHSEGNQTIASGDYSHAEGVSNVASGDNSHAEGFQSIASGDTSHAEGRGTLASGIYSHAEGINNTALGNYSHVEGGYALGFLHQLNIASGISSHAEGAGTKSIGQTSHAEGNLTTASGDISHSEGKSTTALGIASHVEGYGSTTNGDYNHAEGYYTIASGTSSHSEGSYTFASGQSSHSEGDTTTAQGDGSHAEGESTLAGGEASHAEGANTQAIGLISHAEGDSTLASGQSSHSEGNFTTALGYASHAGGINSIASGNTSFVHGSGSTASGNNTIVLGANITGVTDNTTYVDSFNIKTIPNDNSLTSILVEDSSGNVKYRTLSSFVSGLTIQDTYTTGGTYNSSTGVETFTNNTGGTFTVTSLNIQPNYFPITGGTVNGSVTITGNVTVLGTASTFNTQVIQAEDNNIHMNYSGSHLTANGGGMIILSGISNSQDSSITIDGNGNWSASTSMNSPIISATTYLNLPTDIRVTGATYSNNTFTYTNNTGGTFNVLFNTVSGLTVNGNLIVTGTTSLQATSASTVSANTYTAATSMTSPILYGGSLTSSTLTLKSSSVLGGLGADIIFSNGTSEMGRFLAGGASVNAAINYLVIGGGGGGGGGSGGIAGAGGAGGIISGATVITAGTYTITVGNGGAGGAGGVDGSNGSNSVFSGLTAIGGGAGGVNGNPGHSGGSGGGAGCCATNTGGAGTAGQGHAGASNQPGGWGGSGGGANAVGTNSAGGSGGAGYVWSFNNTSYASGGTVFNAAGAASASANTGNGGAGLASVAGLNGGSGVVLFAYPTGSMTAIGGVITTASGNTIHTFTSSGTFTVYIKPNSFGVGVANPTAAVNIKAGTSTTGNAPLKFTSGSSLTTPEAGAIEYDGTQLYITPNSGVRDIITLTSGSTPLVSGQIAFATTSGYLAGSNNLTFDGTGLTVVNSVQYTTPTTGQVVSATTGIYQLVCNPAGTLLALTISFPPNPKNGQQFNVAISQIITTLTTSTSDGSTIDGTIITSAVNSSGGWVYVATPNTWFKTH